MACLICDKWKAKYWRQYKLNAHLKKQIYDLQEKLEKIKGEVNE